MTAEMRSRDLEEDPNEITQVRERRRTMGNREIPAGVEIYEVNGPFFFGAEDSHCHARTASNGRRDRPCIARTA